MAIKNYGQTSQAGQVTEPVVQTAPMGSAQAAQDAFGDPKGVTSGTSYSWLNLGGGSRLGRTRPSKLIQAVDENFQEFMKQKMEGIEPVTIVLDNNSNSELFFTVIVLCGRAPQLPGSPVAYHAYLIAQSGGQIPVEQRNYNGTQVEVHRMPSEAYDAELRALVESKVRAAYPDAQAILETTGEVVPANFDYEDADKLYDLYVNGLMAIFTTFNRNYADHDLNLARAMNDSTLTVRADRLTTGSVEVVDMSDLPIRSDIAITITANAKGQQNQSLNKQRQATLTRLTGYMDFIWSKQPNNQQAWVAPNQQPKVEPLYTPVFVMTSAMPEDIQTEPAQLLAIASATCLMENQRWTFGFMPRKGVGKRKEVDLHDISAIGFDANFEGNKDGVGSRIADTHSDSFTLGKLNGLLQLVSNPVPLIALDVPECGSSTWMHAIFVAAAAGDPVANQTIIEAANYLTNGKFKSIYQGTRVCYEYGGRLHAGYYMDAERKRHDLREIDYLGVLNLFGDRDMNMVRRYSESLNNDSIPLDIRLANRKAILDQFTPVYTGWTRRVVFDAHFNFALAQACGAAGLNLKPDWPYTDATSDVRTPASFLGQALVMQPASTGLFNYNTTFGTAYQGSNWNGYVPTQSRAYTV